MRKSIVGPLLSAALVLSACEPQAEQTAADPAMETAAAPVDLAAEEQRIRQTAEQWVQHVQAGDAESIAGLYTEDGRFMPPNAPLVEGRDAIRQAWQGMLETPGLDLSFAPTAIEVASGGDMAYDVGTYTFAADGPEGRIEDRGKYLVVWVKENGEWKAAADMFNTDVPLPQ